MFEDFKVQNTFYYLQQEEDLNHSPHIKDDKISEISNSNLSDDIEVKRLDNSPTSAVALEYFYQG